MASTFYDIIAIVQTDAEGRRPSADSVLIVLEFFWKYSILLIFIGRYFEMIFLFLIS